MGRKSKRRNRNIKKAEVKAAMERFVSYSDKCPLCEQQYTKANIRTQHHIFPKYWYKGSRLKVVACSKCHTHTFHKLYPMILEKPWSKITCLFNWVEFCGFKGKNAFKLYPQLKDAL